MLSAVYNFDLVYAVRSFSKINTLLYRSKVAVWLSGNVVGHINEVTLHRVGLVLRWVTVCGYTILVFNQATQANSV